MKLGNRLGSPTVTVYTRSGCGLCATAEEIALAEAPGGRVELVDVDGDERLLRAYHLRVPVVAVDGAEVAEVRVEPGSVRRAVRVARMRRLAGRGGGT